MAVREGSRRDQGRGWRQGPGQGLRLRVRRLRQQVQRRRRRQGRAGAGVARRREVRGGQHRRGAGARIAVVDRAQVCCCSPRPGAIRSRPKFPLTFTQMNSVNEISEPMIAHVKKLHPEIKTVVLLNPNDATGQETGEGGQGRLGKEWRESPGKRLVRTRHQRVPAHRRQAEFPQARSGRPGFTPPADAGLVFRELKALGWKRREGGGSGHGSRWLAGDRKDAVDGTYLGAAVAVDGFERAPESAGTTA